MKKLSIFLGSILFAMDITPYFFSVKENYKEYINKKIADRDYNSFFDLSGIGIKLKQNFFKAYLEYAYGDAIYDGAYQDGTKIKAKENEVYIINALISIGNPLSIDLGYRFWNRGKSNYEGDYEEEYYWPYLGLSLNYNFYFYNLSFKPILSYQYAIDPKLKILLGSNPTLDLGNTRGYKIELPIYYKIKNLKIFAFYRYQYWHINSSKTYNLNIYNQIIPIFEPESKTKNQYIGVGLSYVF